MSRSEHALLARDLPALFDFFGVAARADILAARGAQIRARFAAEVREIERLCKKLREKERFKLFREALRLAYESALLHPLPA